MPLDQNDLNKHLSTEQENWDEYASNFADEDIKIVDNISYKKRHWYSKWWGILIIIFVLFAIIWFLYFLSVTKDYLAKIEAGTIHYDMKYMNHTFDSKKDLVAITKSNDDQRWGNEEAKVVIVEFGDFTCPFCKDFNSKIMPELKDKYEDEVLFIYRDYPIMSTAAGESVEIANVANCIYKYLNNKEDYWKVHNYVFLMSDNLINIHEDFSGYYDKEKVQQCINEEAMYTEIMEDYYIADQLGIAGTPVFYINGYKLSGGLPLEEWEYLLNKFLNYKDYD